MKLFINARFATVLAALLSVVTTVFSAAGPGGYHLLKKVVLGGDGFWDYLTVDSEGRRVYLSHGMKVVVVDADTYETVGEIPDTQGVHGIAIVNDVGRGFTSNGRSNNVTIFDLKTLKVLRQARQAPTLTRSSMTPPRVVSSPSTDVPLIPPPWTLPPALCQEPFPWAANRNSPPPMVGGPFSRTLKTRMKSQ